MFKVNADLDFSCVRSIDRYRWTRVCKTLFGRLIAAHLTFSPHFNVFDFFDNRFVWTNYIAITITARRPSVLYICVSSRTRRRPRSHHLLSHKLVIHLFVCFFFRVPILIHIEIWVWVYQAKAECVCITRMRASRTGGKRNSEWEEKKLSGEKIIIVIEKRRLKGNQRTTCKTKVIYLKSIMFMIFVHATRHRASGTKHSSTHFLFFCFFFASLDSVRPFVRFWLTRMWCCALSFHLMWSTICALAPLANASASSIWWHLPYFFLLFFFCFISAVYDFGVATLASSVSQLCIVCRVTCVRVWIACGVG